MRSLLFINRCYWPDAEATGQLLTDLCEFLAESFDVTVLCGQPNSNPKEEDFVRSGEQIRNGVRIVRLRHATLPKRFRAGRLVNLLSFTAAAHRWLRNSQPFDVVISETDPFFLPIVAARHADRSNTRFVAYIQDVYPDIAVGLGKASEGWIVRFIRKHLQRAYASASAIVVLSESMKDQLVDWGLPTDRFRIIPNWVDCDKIRPVKQNNSFRREHQLDDKFVVMHSGNMGLTQQLEHLVLAAGDTRINASIRFVLIGNGARKKTLEKLALQNQQKNVLFLPYQPRDSLAESLSAADLHVISIDPRIGGCLLPSKLYGILASGTPILVIADPDNDVSKLVTHSKIGWVAPPGNAQTIASKVLEALATPPQIRQNMAKNARSLAESQYDRLSVCTTFSQTVSSILDESARQA